jgi:hypothetical protein
MAKPNDLTSYACTGFGGFPNPHIATSPARYAHALGAWFLRTGRTLPRDVRMGRGDSIRANDMRFTFTDTADCIRFERVE